MTNGRIKDFANSLEKVYCWLNDETDNSISKNEYSVSYLNVFWKAEKTTLSVQEARILCVILSGPLSYPVGLPTKGKFSCIEKKALKTVRKHTTSCSLMF